MERHVYLHGTTGRGSPWCKLLSVHRAMSSASIVVFVDSDAWLRDMTTYISGFRASPHCVWLPSDRPWGYANAAMQMWKTTRTCRRHLRDWWLRNVSCCNHKYEQDAVPRSQLTHAFPFDWMRPSESWKYEVHLPHVLNKHRVPTMTLEMTSYSTHPGGDPLVPSATPLDLPVEAAKLEAEV